MIFVILNLYILLAFYLFTKRKFAQPLSESILSICTLLIAQIVITQLILGVLGFLTDIYLLIFNITISSVFIFLSRNHIQNIQSFASHDYKIFSSLIRNSYTPYNLLLILMLTLTTLWIAAAAYLLPPRAIDDITYHLTTIIEFIKQNKIFILPIEYRPHVTMPLNAELIFMWPLIFFKNDHSIGIVQYFVALIGIVVIYRFSRLFSIGSKISLFVSLLFIFSPVVLAQSGAAYIDIIVSVFFLIALYFSTQYYLTKDTQYLYLAAISIGLLSGMKYNILLLALSLQILIIPNILRSDKKTLITYFVLILIFGGYWYIRNLLVFGSIFPFLDSILRTTDSEISNPINIQYFITVLIEKLKLLFLHDTGIGSLNGGYGINFWTIALPCWVFCLIKSFQLKRENKLFPIYIWMQILLGFVFLFLSPVSRLYFRTRYSIFIIAIALIALAKVLNYYKDHKIYKNLIITACCLFALFSFINLANTEIPSYRIDVPLKDRMSSKKEYSKQRYLLFTRMDMAYIWETLDFITKDYKEGLNIYFAMTHKDFATPFYGSNFKNNIWNFRSDINNPPDAFVYQFKKGAPIKYLRKIITLDETLMNPQYQMIDKAGSSFLIINRNFLNIDSEIKQSLLQHYRNYYSDEIKILNNSVHIFDDNSPIVTSSYIGFVFLYLKLSDTIKNKLYLVPESFIGTIIKHNKLSSFYTINHINKNYNPKHIFDFKVENAKISIYKNSL